MLDEAARLQASNAVGDATSAADRKARSLAMQAKLRDIAEAQVRTLKLVCVSRSRSQIVQGVKGQHAAHLLACFLQGDQKHFVYTSSQLSKRLWLHM